MKKLYVKNHADIQGKTFGSQGNEFMVKEIVPQEEASRCRANFVEVEPGNNAYGYHYHETEEEIFTSSAEKPPCAPQTAKYFSKPATRSLFPADRRARTSSATPQKPKNWFIWTSVPSTFPKSSICRT